ncbi:hypothetical protein [Sulfuricystis multivorans]|uniref:hypothetical protein n=1 Tax=Sulfuricystis multivorans TaxID=2211108 RepID=UPI000F83DF02|nr:hypothetical protein [Sulfuricystis multivorans]
MRFPDFFSAAPVIRMRDPLAEFLGATGDGEFEYRFEDAVRLAGHSCPTVASAFLMTRAALARLYPEELPVRGEIRVDLADERDAGVAGVIASILTLVTGAAGDTGFKGIGGRFDRRERLFFAQPLEHGSLRFTRLDSGAAVEVAADLSHVPGDPRLAELLPRCRSGRASTQEMSTFRSLWQDRVRRLLLEHADDPQTILIFPI